MTGQPALGTLAAFVAELRAVGLPVSVSENLDATAALMAMPLVDRASLKSALAATLVKNSDHYAAFELVFDIFFAGRRLDADLTPEPSAGAPSAAGNGAGRDGVLAALGDPELNDLLLQRSWEARGVVQAKSSPTICSLFAHKAWARSGLSA